MHTAMFFIIVLKWKYVVDLFKKNNFIWNTKEISIVEKTFQSIKKEKQKYGSRNNKYKMLTRARTHKLSSGLFSTVNITSINIFFFSIRVKKEREKKINHNYTTNKERERFVCYDFHCYFKRKKSE